MKKLIVFLLLLLFLALWGFGVILPDAGYVLVILGQKTLETSLWFTAFAVLAVALTWWLITRFVFLGWSIAQRVTDFFVFGSIERASKRTSSGLVDFLSGDWLQARKKLLRTATKVESPLVNYLAAARASFELGDQDDAIKILHDAKQKYKQFAIPIGVAQAKMEMRGGRLEQAKNILQLLQQQAPKNAIVINCLREFYELKRDWLALAAIFPLIKKYKLCSVAEVLSIEASIAGAQLQQAGNLASTQAIGDRLLPLRKAWVALPSAQQRLPRVVAIYAKVLIDNLQDTEAELVLRKALGKSWDDELISLYGVLRVVDIAEVIKTAETWLRYYPQNAALLRALGRLSLRNQLWGVARDYFQRSLAIQKDVETYAELARLLKNLGETQKSLDIYAAAFAQTISNLPDLPQPLKSY
jgi:HemY protein